MQTKFCRNCLHQTLISPGLRYNLSIDIVLTVVLVGQGFLTGYCQVLFHVIFLNPVIRHLNVYQGKQCSTN